MNKTKVRILDDIRQSEKVVEIDRDRGELIISLLQLRRILRKELCMRLTLHLRHDLITLHWWAHDDVMHMTEMPDRVLAMLEERRIGA